MKGIAIKMKNIKNLIKKVILIISISVVLLIVIGILVDRDILKIEEENNVSIKYTPENIGNYINEDEIEDSHYFSSLEESIKADNPKEADLEYQNNIEEIIKRFDSDKYVTIYFKSPKGKDIECITMAKFIKKVIDGSEKYAYLSSMPTEIRSNAKSVGSIKNLIRDQLTVSDYIQNMNVNPDNSRFVFGDCRAKEVYKLKIEGQEPAEVIQYDSCQGKRYFWYYENLESNIAGKNLKFTLE
ncbi:hypothetical protein [Faecalimonas sp.]